MPRPAQLERAVGRDERLDAAGQLREARPGLDGVELGGHVERAFEVVGTRPEGDGELEQDAVDLGGLLFFELDDVVVDLDGAERLEEQALSAGRRAVHDARNRSAVLGAHHQHVAAVAVGDHLLLQVLRRLALAQERFERRAQLRLLAPQPLADARQRRAGVVGHFARRFDLAPHGGNLRPERGDGLDQPLEHRVRLRRRRDDAPGRVDRFEVVGQAEQAQRLERAPLDLQRVEDRLQLRRRPQREPR